MKSFEYEILTDDDDWDIDQLGKEAWELVTVLYRSWENERKGYTESSTTFYFKREKLSFYPPRPVGVP